MVLCAEREKTKKYGICTGTLRLPRKLSRPPSPGPGPALAENTPRRAGSFIRPCPLVTRALRGRQPYRAPRWRRPSASWCTRSCCSRRSTTTRALRRRAAGAPAAATREQLRDARRRHPRGRQDTNKRVVGVLLGEVSKGRLDITNSYAGARARAKPRSCRCAAGTRGRCLCDARAALPLFFVSPRSPVRGGRARPRNLVFRPQLPRADVPHAPTNQRRATAACRPACRGDAQQQRLNARLRLPRARSQGDGGRLVQHGSQGQGGARVGAARRAPKNLLTAGAAAGARGLPLASRAPARR